MYPRAKSLKLLRNWRKSVFKLLILNFTAQLNPMVKEWQHHSLSEIKYSYIITDVLYIKVREDAKVVSKSCHIAVGINEQGEREIIELMIQNRESKSSWNRFFEYLKDRGLHRVGLIISVMQKSFIVAT